MIPYHIRDRGEILTDKLPENAISLAMENTHLLYAYQYGIIDEVISKH